MTNNRYKNNFMGKALLSLILIIISFCFIGCDEQHMVSIYLFDKPSSLILCSIIAFLFGLLGFFKPIPILGLVPLFLYAAIIIIEVILYPTSHNLLPFVLLGSLFLGSFNWVMFFIGKGIRNSINKKSGNNP